jgi:hypothetical protein
MEGGKSGEPGAESILQSHFGFARNFLDRGQLTHAGYIVHKARSGAEAAEWLSGLLTF